MQKQADDSFEDGRNPPADAPALKWPVLARLPCIGEPSPQRCEPIAEYGEPHAKSSSGREEVSPLNLRIAETPALSRSYLDPAHTTRLPLETTASADAIRPAGRSSEPSKRLHRIDAGVPRSSVMPMAVSRVPWPSQVSETLASRVFQWHAVLAPYAGVAMTFLLALSAGMLYWATMGAPRATGPSGNAPAAPTWTTDSLHSPANGQNERQLPVANDGARAFSWSRGGGTGGDLHVANPAEDFSTTLETTESLAAELATAQPNAEKTESPQADASAIGSLTPNPGDAGRVDETQAPVTVESPEPIAGMPLSITYPTTPFASFDFGLAPQTGASTDSAGQTSQGIVAEVSADGMNLPTSTR